MGSHKGVIIDARRYPQTAELLDKYRHMLERVSPPSGPGRAESFGQNLANSIAISNHYLYLGAEKDQLKDLRRGLMRDAGIPDDVKLLFGHEDKIEALPEAKKVLFHHVSQRLEILDKVRGEYKYDNEGVERSIAETATEALAFLKGERGDSGVLKKVYDPAKRRPDTIERYAFLDRFYEHLAPGVFDWQKAEEQMLALARVPVDFRKAQWKVMLSLVSEEYGIGLDGDRLDILSMLYTRLSDHQRSATNNFIPDTHKLRHNPAIHSLHTLTLIDKMFDDAEVALDKGRLDGRSRGQVKERLVEYKQKLMLGALLHDLGEVEGELSNGESIQKLQKEQIEIDRKWEDEKRDPKTKPDLVKQFENEREALENAALERRLDRVMKHLNIKGEKAKEIRAEFTEAIEMFEDTSQWMGRFGRICENTQTNHDYLRFNELPGATPLRALEDISYTMDYVPKRLFGAKWTTDAKIPGEVSLRDIVGHDKEGVAYTHKQKEGGVRKDDSVDVLVRNLLTDSIEREYTALYDKQVSQYGAERKTGYLKESKICAGVGA